MSAAEGLPVLGVGIIGCGAAAQALHLPALASLSSQFRIAHLADASGAVAEGLASRLGARATTDPDTLLADPDVDVVLVAAPDAYHPRFAVDACRAGKRAVLVEKPLALTTGEAEAVVAESERTGVPVLVGTMHRYDAAFDEALEHIGRIPPELVVAQTFYGLNDLWITDAVQMLRGPLDVNDGEGPLAWLAAGAHHAGLDASWRWLQTAILGLGLSSHDLALLRVTLGEPDEIEWITPLPGTAYQMVLRYGEVRATVMVHENSGRYQDWRFRWIGRDAQVEVEFPQSWGASTPSKLTVHRHDDDYDHREVWAERHESGFRREWRHVYEVAVSGATPRTPAREGLGDVGIIERAVSAAAGRVATRDDALGVALLGAGWITAIHAPVLDALPDARIRVVASRTVRSAERRAWPVRADVATFDDVDAVVRRDDVDVVLIAGPPSVHADHAIAALDAGKHVIVEKPLARTLAEADAIVEAEARSAGSVAYAENYAFMPVFVEAARLVRDGAIGEVLDSVGAFTFHGRPQWGAFLTPAWGGGCLFDMGAHTIWWLLGVLDHPEVVSVRTRAMEGLDGEGDNYVDVELCFADGRRAGVVSSWRDDGDERSGIELTGSEGTLVLRSLPHAAIEVTKHGADGPELLSWPNPHRGTVGTFYGKSGYTGQLESFLSSFRAGEAPNPGATAGRRVLEIISAAYHSAATGETVSLPFTGPRDRTPYELWKGGTHR